MPTDPDWKNDPTFQWTQAIHRDLSNLRDNHLAHIQEDLTTLKHDVGMMKKDIDDLKGIKDEALSILRRYSGRIFMGIITAIGVAMGAPMAVDMI